MRENCNEATFTSFADLVKTYQRSHHKVLIKVFEQYGAPPKFCSCVEQMYTDFIVVSKIRKSIAEILLEEGVRQGNNMAPVLFLFLMSAFAKSLREICGENELPIFELKQPSNDDFKNRTGPIKRKDNRIQIIET